MHLRFCSYCFLNFVELLESQKLSFSIILVLKGLTKQNDPKQNFTHYSSPVNVEYELRGLMAEDNNVYKTIRKRIYAIFVRYKILKVQ